MGLGVGVKVWLVGVRCTQELGGGGLSLDAVSVVIGVLTSLTEAVAGKGPCAGYKKAQRYPA